MKLTTKQKWFLTMMVIGLLSGFPTMAQVTIGDLKKPETFSILELISGDNKGLRLPQITSTNQRDTQITNSPGFTSSIHAKGLQIFNLETKQVETWDGFRWVGEGEKAIWLPSTEFPWGNLGEIKTVNLFTEVYKKAFTTTGGYGAGARYVSSEGKKIDVPGYSDKDYSDFYYVITDYDDTAIENVSVTANGVLTYKIKKASSGDAWINVLLVKK